MWKPKSIPVWEFSEMSNQHFGGTIEELNFSSFHKLFHINRIEDYRDKIRFPLPPHRKPIYDFLFLTKGKTQRSKALTPYEITKNTFFFLPAYQITEHAFMSEDIEGYFCHFNYELFTNYLPQHNLLRDFPFLQFMSKPVVKIDENIIPFILNIFKRLEGEYKKENTEKFDLIVVYLLTLFTEVNRFFITDASLKKDAKSRITESYKDALSRNIYERQKVSEYAQLLNISPNHLNKCIKKTVGISAQDLLNDMIVLEAKVLLRQTDLQINEIAYKLSQKNHSDFSRFFKSKTGMTPKEYRQLV
ncbi:MAG: helix-turn-helix domain-containing protein [Saprospiraceae bacterium]